MSADPTRRIRVTLTEEQWNALVRCATGELEGATEADWASGNLDNLASAVKAMERGRRGRRKA